jgi:para-nitrobenzyl esterase
MSFGDHLGSSRRNFLKGSAGVALATNMVIRGGVANAATAAPVADTTYGKVRGAVVDGVTQFLGIRYGADTGGANRFLPPKPPAAGSRLREALAKGTPSPQDRTR